MTNVILKERRYAGSPHVRFDEAEAALDKSMRGAQLYRSTLAVVALAASAVVLPAVTLQAFENSCIISGSTERFCVLEDWASGLHEFESRVQTAGYGAPTDPFESRVSTRGFGDPLENFSSDKSSSLILIIR